MKKTNSAPYLVLMLLPLKNMEVKAASAELLLLMLLRGDRGGGLQDFHNYGFSTFRHC